MESIKEGRHHLRSDFHHYLRYGAWYGLFVACWCVGLTARALINSSNLLSVNSLHDWRDLFQQWRERLRSAPVAVLARKIWYRWDLSRRLSAVVSIRNYGEIRTFWSRLIFAFGIVYFCVILECSLRLVLSFDGNKSGGKARCGHYLKVWRLWLWLSSAICERLLACLCPRNWQLVA